MKFDSDRDCMMSYYAAITEIGRRVKAGASLPTGGYFTREDEAMSDQPRQPEPDEEEPDHGPPTEPPPPVDPTPPPPPSP